MMYLKVHLSPKGKVVAVCDADLLGKVLEEEGGAFMDLQRHRAFYEGKKADAQDVADALRGFSSANLVGKEAVGIALEMKLADEGQLMRIGQVPLVQLYSI